MCALAPPVLAPLSIDCSPALPHTSRVFYSISGIMSTHNPATSYRDDSRDPPASAGPGLISAGRNKHHFRVPVIGRIRAQLPHGGRAEVPLRE